MNNKLLKSLTLYASILTLSNDAYTILLPSNINLANSGSFEIAISQNNLQDSQKLYINIADNFVLHDTHGKDDISGNILNNEICFTSTDNESKTINYEVIGATVGQWSGLLDLSINLSQEYSYNLTDGKSINTILKNINPTTITFSHDAVSLSDPIDVSYEKNETVLLYNDNGNVTITNNANEPIKLNSSCLSMFANLKNLQYIYNFDSLDSSSCTNMSKMFQKCTSLKEVNLSNINTNSVTNMSYMFQNCTNLESIGDISNWDVSNVSNISYMFNNCEILEYIGNISNWNVSNIKNISGLFCYCKNLKNIGDISSWDVSNVTNISYMFQSCENLEYIGNIENWNVSNVTKAEYLFYKCYKLNNYGNIGNWNISNKCTNLSYMFANMSYTPNVANSSFFPTTLDLSGWDVSNVTDMSSMFSNLYSLQTLNIQGWNTNKLVYSNDMFLMNDVSIEPTLQNIIGLNSLDVSSLLDMSHMFFGCKNFNSDFSSWQPSSVKKLDYAFYNCSSLNLATLNNWNTYFPSNATYTNCFSSDNGTLSGAPSWYN